MSPALKKVLLGLGHLAVGGAVAAVAPEVSRLIPLIPHIDPFTAAVVGSGVSSLASHLASKLQPKG